MSSLLVYTDATANGHRVTAFLEELKVAYGTEYEAKRVDISKKEQKEAWYLKLNPDSKIPLLEDRSRNNFTIAESAAINLYLQQHYDKENKFGFEQGSDDYFEMLQWISFIHGGLAPTGQFFLRMFLAGENPPKTSEKTIESLKQSLSVLNQRLSNDREYLVGPGSGKYSLADINAAAVLYRATPLFGNFGTPIKETWPHVDAWLTRVGERPGFKAGVHIFVAPA